MVELIAEVSSNHGGDLGLAKEFIHRFAEAGADWVKFQTTRVKHLRREDPQYEWFKRAELSDEAHHILKAECEQVGTKFLTTVYHAADVPLLKSLGLTAVKIGSGEAHDYRLERATVAFRTRFVGCGLTSPTRVDGHAVRRLKCVTRYPAPAMTAWDVYEKERFHNDQWEAWYEGWSDHCVGLDGCKTAICCGATIIEKHVCLDHQARPVKSFEATIEEFKELRAFADEDPTRFIGRWQCA